MTPEQRRDYDISGLGLYIPRVNKTTVFIPSPEFKREWKRIWLKYNEETGFVEEQQS